MLTLNIFWNKQHILDFSSSCVGPWCLKSPITCRLVSGLYLFALFWIKLTVKLWRRALRFHLLNFKSLEGHLVMSIQKILSCQFCLIFGDIHYFVDRLQLFYFLTLVGWQKEVFVAVRRLVVAYLIFFQATRGHGWPQASHDHGSAEGRPWVAV